MFSKIDDDSVNLKITPGIIENVYIIIKSRFFHFYIKYILKIIHELRSIATKKGMFN